MKPGLDAVDELMTEYVAAANQVDLLTQALRLATGERDAVLAALSDTGLTQQAVAQLTGVTISTLRTALRNDWLRQRGEVWR